MARTATKTRSEVNENATNDFLEHAQELEELREQGEPIKASAEGTRFIVLSKVKSSVRQNPREGEDATYFFVDAKKIEGTKLADIQTRWFLNRRDVRLLEPFVKNGGIEGKAFVLYGTKSATRKYQGHPVWEDYTLERLPNLDKLAKHA